MKLLYGNIIREKYSTMIYICDMLITINIIIRKSFCELCCSAQDLV